MNCVFAQDITLLDGGLGTTLEDVFCQNINDTPLWSAGLIRVNPETIIAAHSAFLEAGARVLLTSSYQCSFQTFERAGYSRDEAVSLMLKTVDLAAEARQRFVYSHKETRMEDIKIALSLGPYGAMLTPAQEFDGFYPPPFGPKKYTADGDNCNAFSEQNTASQEAEDALTTFHLENLSVFNHHPESWKVIDFIAFETVPLAREIRAIRNAIGMLAKNALRSGKVDMETKQWWISTVWPEGRFPEENAANGERLEVAAVVHALLAEETTEFPAPSGIGVNCICPEFLPHILDEMDRAVDGLKRDSEERPFLVVYPNGGNVYDTKTRTWTRSENQETPGEGDSWAIGLADVARKARDSKRWSTVVVGGCCKTTPEHIRALSRTLQNASQEVGCSVHCR